MTVEVSRAEVISFRLNAHNLTERVSEDGLLGAAGRCAVQNSPPGSALLALHARVRGLTEERVADDVAQNKSLLQAWSMRGAPFFFPTADAAVFTTGVLPPDEGALRHFLPGLEGALDQLGISLTAAVDLTRAELAGVLSGRQLAINELGTELAGQVAKTLPAGQRQVWEGEGPYAPGQPLGEAVVHFCLRILSLQGVLCFAPRAAGKAPLALTQEWLGRPIRAVEPAVARAELLRRYLRCYGPSTRRDFAAWLGVRSTDADAWWVLIENELTPVGYGGGSWILSEDLHALRSAPEAMGLRLLPPRDPYTQLRDRSTILDTAHHRQVWRSVGEPGTVLANGRIVGTWRARKQGQALHFAISTFRSLPARARSTLLAEAAQIAGLRGAASSSVSFEVD